MQQLGKYILIAGLILVMAGLAIIFLHDKLSWFGNLPGDIRIKKDNFSFYFPITSMILISLVLSLLIWLIGKILK